MLLPNGETLEQHKSRNLVWWVENRHTELTTRVPFYINFLEAVAFNPDTMHNKIVGDLGCGPTGGILKQLYPERPVSKRVFIDCYMDDMKRLDMAKWDGKDEFFTTFFEDMSAIPDRYIDILFSYNALDHGWDIYKSLDEALRISKSGIIAFDCKNGEGPEHDKIDHYQTVNFNNVKKHLLKKSKKAHIDVADLTRIKPNFSYDHNWGFPVALILYEEVTQ